MLLVSNASLRARLQEVQCAAGVAARVRAHQNTFYLWHIRMLQEQIINKQ